MNNIKNLLLGPNKYTTGLIFLLGNIMGFFNKMEELNIKNANSIVILCMMVILAKVLT